MNTMKEITKKRLFLAHQHEEEEKWLNKLSEEGWHLLYEPAIYKYRFNYDREKRYIYRLDFDSVESSASDMVSFYTELGWKKIGRLFNGWYYFRKEAGSGDEHHLYSDSSSKIELYKRIRKRLGIAGFVPLLCFMPLFSNLLLVNDSEFSILIPISGFLSICLAGFLGRIIYRISRMISKLEKGNY